MTLNAEFFQYFLVGVGTLITAVAGVTIGVWRWDARRIEERAKDREHELKLAALKIEREAEERERLAQSSIQTLQQQVISIQQTIENRLFVALDQQHGTNRDLSSSVQAHMQLINEAHKTQLGAIQALSKDLAGLKDHLSTEYRAMLDQVGGILNQTLSIHTTVTDLVARMTDYHTSVTHAIEGSSGDRHPAAPDAKPSV